MQAPFIGLAACSLLYQLHYSLPIVSKMHVHRTFCTYGIMAFDAVYNSSVGLNRLIHQPSVGYVVKTTPRMIPAYATGFSVLATSPSAASTSITISSPASTFPDRISFAESVSTVF